MGSDIVDAASVAVFPAALFVPFSPGYFGISGRSFTLGIGLPALIAVAVMLVLHELVHLACIPKSARAGRTVLGITYAGCFVVCEEEIGKNRHLLIGLAPFLAISVADTLVLGALGLLTPLVLAALTLNALGSAVDLLTAAAVLRKVPQGAVLTAAGMHTCRRG